MDAEAGKLEKEVAAENATQDQVILCKNYSFSNLNFVLGN